MNNWVILGLQFSVSALAAALIFFEYLQPRLAKLPFERAVLPMLLLQAYRFTGMTLLVGGAGRHSHSTGCLGTDGLG